MCSEPHLGCATTREMLEEIACRIEMQKYNTQKFGMVQCGTTNNVPKPLKRLLEKVAAIRLEILASGISLDYRTIDQQTIDQQEH